jgi:flagellar protein FlgJ
MDIKAPGFSNSDLINPGLMNIDNYRMSAQAAPSSKNFEEIIKRAARPPGSSDDAAEGRRISAAAPEAGGEKIDKTEKLYRLCLELETFLVKNLLTTMRNTVQKSGLVDDSFAGKMYEDMLYDEYAKDLTKNANFGMAEQAYLQLKKFS